MSAVAFAAERWYADKGRQPVAVETLDSLGSLEIAEVSFAEGPPSRYALVGDEPGWGELLAGARGRFFFDGSGPPPGADELRLPGDQSHTSWRVGRFAVKCFRRLEPGAHPEAELGAALADAGFVHTPRFEGALHWRGGEEPTTVAVVHRFVAGARDGWEWTAARATAGDPSFAERLGVIAAALHETLASVLPSRPSESGERARWLDRANEQLDDAIALIGGELAPHVVRVRDELAPLGDPAPTWVARTHGDLHVGQVLWTASAPYVVDFEGQPQRPLSERRAPDTPLRDLASLARSIDHCGRYAIAERAADPAAVERWIDDARRALFAGYGEHDETLRRALEWERAIYEFTYAARYLPGWLYAPRGGLAALLRGRS